MKFKTKLEIIRTPKTPKATPEKSLFDEMLNIILYYYPDKEASSSFFKVHLEQSQVILWAKNGETLTGFSAASLHRLKTPFYKSQIPMIFLRLIYLHPNHLYRGVSTLLWVKTMQILMGQSWFTKRFALICRTQNPGVIKVISHCNDFYPKPEETLPPSIQKFATSLLPLLNANSIDENGCLSGSINAYKGMDYTTTWNRYFRSGDARFNELVLSRAFQRKNGHIYNKGAFLFVTGYAEPLRFQHFAAPGTS